MTSRLLRRLDAAIAVASSPVDAACLGAERAVLLARRGQLELAGVELEAVRQRFGQAVHPRVTGWLCLAEGLLNHFADHSPAALDRLQRAHALANAVQLRPLCALAAAWLAHAHYVQSDDVSMVRLLAEALRTAAPDHHAARARACLVAGRAYQLADRAEVARTYYVQAREHAMAEGDDATVSAILHDMARHRAHQVQLAQWFEPGADARQALLAIDSWLHFDRGAGTAPQEAVAALLRAQILVVQGQFEEALALYEKHLAAALAQGLARREASLRADMAWCRQQLGCGDAARVTARDAEAALLGAVDLDDRAMAHARLVQVFDGVGLPAVAAQHRSQSQAQWRQWLAARAEMLQLLDAMLPSVSAVVVTTDTSETIKSTP